MTATTRLINTRPRTSIAGQLAELRAALEQQRSFRTEQLAELASAAAGSIDDPRDEVTDALRAGATSALHSIEAALARMDAGQYGDCEVCRGEIPLERLEILPMAAMCMPCAHAQHAK